MMTKTHKTLLLTSVLAASAGAIAFLLRDDTARYDTAVQWWHLLIAYAVAEWAVAHIEVRREAHTLSLSETVTFVGLLVVTPVALILARVLGAAVALLVRRQPPTKFAFNLALFGCDAAIAGALFHLVAHGSAGEPVLWLFAGLAVVCAALLSMFSVFAVIAIHDPEGQRTAGRPWRLLGTQLMTALVATSIGAIGAAALARVWTSVGYLVVLLGGTLVVLREQAQASQRSSDLEAISGYTSTLVGLKGTDEVLAEALGRVGELVRGSRAVLVVPGGALLAPGCHELIDGELVVGPSVPSFLHGVRPVESARLLSSLRGGPEAAELPDGLVAPLRLGEVEGLVIVWERSTAVGAFTSAEIPLFASLVDQTQIAMQRAVLVDQLEHDAHHDLLTALPNRLGLQRAFGAFTGTSGTLFVIDLDRFKEVNDTLGHPTGDRALGLVAERLRSVTGDQLLLARLGGDEFAVFDPEGGDAAAAVETAERLIEAIVAPVRFDDLALQIGASIGIARLPDHGSDLTSLMSHADIAMYAAKAKQSGWQFYSAEDDDSSPRRLELVSSLRRAIDDRELQVWYQPKVRVDDGSLVGVEALARWEHPRYGFIPPDEFIAIAEGSGMMRELTDAVLRLAMADAARWLEAGRHIPVAVNLSTRNLLDDTLPPRLLEMMQLHGIGADLLEFEVTETSIMLDKARVAAVLDQLRSIGFKLAIDDYGTGYSSLSYLRDLPVHQLKIDRSFVSHLDLDAHNEVIVRSTIDLGHNLGLQVVAEGVERAAELQRLEELGCDYAQGYFISRPMPRPRFEEWLASVSSQPDTLIRR